MGFLLDTNLLSELRKGSRCHPSVRHWYDPIPAHDLFTSVLVMGELRRGIENLRPRDAVSAQFLEAWLNQLEGFYGERILPVTLEVSDLWGRLSPKAPLPVADGLLAATALRHRLTLVTRNTRDVRRSGVAFVNPFET